MNKTEQLTQLVKIATAAVDFKQRATQVHLRRAAVHQLHIKQVVATERDLRRELEPMFQKQIADMVSKLQRIRDKEISELSLKYSPDQPRDDHGRFGTGGGGSSVGGVTDAGDTNLQLGNKIVLSTITSIESQLVLRPPKPKVILEDADTVTPPGVQHGERFGYYDSYANTITLASSKQAVTQEESAALRGTLVDSSLSGALRHEYGHCLYTKKVDNAQWEELAKDIDGSLVSGVATQNSEELFCESFSYRTSKDYERGELPASVDKFLDAYVRTPGTFDPNNPDITKSLTPAKLINRIFDPRQATKELTNKILPVLAVRMVEAAHNQLKQLGVKHQKHVDDLDVKFSPTQPRDDHGKWTSGGGLASLFAGEPPPYSTHPGWHHTYSTDTSGWPQNNKAAECAAKKIALMEQAAKAGDMDFVNSVQVKSKLPNKYQKAVINAKQSLLAAKQQNVQSSPPKKGLKYVDNDQTLVDANGWQQLGPKLGTQPGGTFKGDDGKQYYLKQPSDPNAAVNEVMANSLYQAAGATVPQAMLIHRDGKLGIATEWTESQKADWGNANTKAAAAEDFAAHAWMANWDCIGAGSENPMDNVRMVNVGGNTKAVAVDVGGALGYKGTGTPKAAGAFGNTVGEWDSLRMEGINPSSAKVFGGMTKDQLISSGKKVAAVPDATIDAVASKYAHGSDAADLASKLKARRDDIAGRVKLLEEGKSTASQTPKTVTTPDGAKVGVQSQGYVVPTAPIITSAKNGPVYQPKFNKLHELAAAGDWEGVKNFKTNEHAKQCYAKKLNEYKQSLLVGHGNGAAVQQSKQSSTAVTHTPIKIDPTVLPAAPSFSTKNETHKVANETLAKQALNYAKSGDLDALKSMALPPSPKLKAWHESLMTNVATQLNPPPPKSISGSIANIDKMAAPLVGKQSSSTIGKYLVTGKVDPIPKFEKTGVWVDDPGWNAGRESYLKLPAGERKAIKSYTGGSYHAMNSALRNFSELTNNSSALKAARGVMKAAIPIKEGTMLSRKHYLESSDLVTLSKSVGCIIQDRGIISTSTSTTTTTTWLGVCQLNLTVGPGVRGLPVDKISSHTGEREVILPPNTRYLVTDVSVASDGATVHAVVLPTLDTQCCPP
jgi:hypothetical protein